MVGWLVAKYIYYNQPTTTSQFTNTKNHQPVYQPFYHTKHQFYQLLSWLVASFTYIQPMDTYGWYTTKYMSTITNHRLYHHTKNTGFTPTIPGAQPENSAPAFIPRMADDQVADQAYDEAHPMLIQGVV